MTPAGLAVRITLILAVPDGSSPIRSERRILRSQSLSMELTSMSRISATSRAFSYWLFAPIASSFQPCRTGTQESMQST
jgi:hypothetical protein